MRNHRITIRMWPKVRYLLVPFLQRNANDLRPINSHKFISFTSISNIVRYVYGITELWNNSHTVQYWNNCGITHIPYNIGITHIPYNIGITHIPYNIGITHLLGVLRVIPYTYRKTDGFTCMGVTTNTAVLRYVYGQTQQRWIRGSCKHSSVGYADHVNIHRKRQRPDRQYFLGQCFAAQNQISKTRSNSGYGQTYLFCSHIGMWPLSRIGMWPLSRIGI